MSNAALSPEFWDERYQSNRTPWDFGGVPAKLREFLATPPVTGTCVLIPGCGSGYEIAAFSAAGFAVTAIDISPAAIARARGHARAGGPRAAQIMLGDFFKHSFADEPFDCIYERTFLCALPPERWPAIVERTVSLLKPGGLLFGFYFFGDKEDGPPFGLAPGEDARLFGARFELVTDALSADALPLFAGCERWQVRRSIPRP